MLSMEEIARALGKGKESESGGRWVTCCPAHNDAKSSLSIRTEHGKMLFKCHAGCSQKDVIDALISQNLWANGSSAKTWKPIRPVPEGISAPSEVKHYKFGKPARSWTYREIDGSLIGLIHRFETSEGKTLVPMSYCFSNKGEKKWFWKSFDKPRPFYNLPLLAKLKNAPVLIFEGEKAADAAQEIFGDDYICTSWPGGSSVAKYADIKVFKGREIILWPDNDEPGLKAMNQLAEMMTNELGHTPKMVNVPEGLPKGWDIADEIPENAEINYYALVNSAETSDLVSDNFISSVNKKYALIIVGGKPKIMYQKPNQSDGSVDVEYWSVDAFRQYLGNELVPNGRTQMKLGDYWLSHKDRKSYKGVIFKPNQEWDEHYNIWQGLSYEPDQTGSWSIFRQHLFNNVCDKNQDLFNWIFGWFSHIMQNPQEKPGTSLTLRGQQGSGKTIVGKIFGNLIKKHYLLIDQERYLFGNFNSHLATTILLHSDEGFWGGDPRNIGKLKSLVTSDSQIIEYKGLDALSIDNYLRLLITSNEDWVVPASFEERRFAIVDVGNDNQQDEQFFVAMLEELENGGYEALLYDMLNFDLKSVNIRKIPYTAALSQQKELSMQPVEAYWFTCLEQGNTLLSSRSGWLSEVKTADIYDDCINYLNKIGYRRVPHMNVFFRKLREFVREGDMARKLIGPDRQSAITIPPLKTARQFFDRKTRNDHDWIDESKEETQLRIGKGIDVEIDF